MAPPTPRLTKLLSLVVLALVPACTSFDNQWCATKPPTQANPAAPIAGKWEGTWQSDATAYIGPVQALVVPKTTSDAGTADSYRMQMKMVFFQGLASEYTITLNAKRDLTGKLRFTGAKDFGFCAGGIYNFDGYVEGRTLFCDFTSGQDCGTILLQRKLTEVD